jgi:N,N'-diacetylchitobiose phosphorylase
MVSFLHHWALRAFVEAAEYLGCEQDAREYAARGQSARGLRKGALGWRVVHARHHRQGRPDRHAGERGRQDLSSKATPGPCFRCGLPERGRLAMDAVDRHLYSPYGIHLLWPAFSKPDDDIGFVTRVYKGIKENAAIFSHPNPWAVIAECKLGRGSRAMKFYDALLPANQNDRSRFARRSRIPIASS